MPNIPSIEGAAAREARPLPWPKQVDALNGKVWATTKCEPSNDPTPGCSKKATGKSDSINSPLYLVLSTTLRSHVEKRRRRRP
mmetsp:Transcript_4035/g.7147  ORF Transcript_4035/g.7147 Transcript_4035/m.7147 type:complete len:83 (+) Transcript_4035:250-498(+)